MFKNILLFLYHTVSRAPSDITWHHYKTCKGPQTHLVRVPLFPQIYRRCAPTSLFDFTRISRAHTCSRVAKELCGAQGPSGRPLAARIFTNRRLRVCSSVSAVYVYNIYSPLCFLSRSSILSFSFVLPL